MRDTFSAKFPFDILMSDSGTAAYCCPLRCSGLPSAYGGNRLHPPEANLNFFFLHREDPFQVYPLQPWNPIWIC